MINKDNNVLCALAYGLESYMIAEEGLFSNLKDKRDAENAAKIDLWHKEKYEIKKIIEEIAKVKIKEYKDLDVKYTFDPKEFTFGDEDGCLQISDPKCDQVIVEFIDKDEEYTGKWNNFFYDLKRAVSDKLKNDIKSKITINAFDDSIIQVNLYDGWRLMKNAK